ncbi:hypothetical protein D3C72_556070 [compost metagenome]
MTIIDRDPGILLIPELGAVAQLRQMTIEGLHSFLGQRLWRLCADHQIVVQIRQTTQALGFDQAQQQVELKHPAMGLAIPTQVKHGLTTHQPMLRHQPRLATQHIDICPRTLHGMQAALIVSLHLVGTDSLAGRRLGQFDLQMQQAASKQFITRLQQHQPFARQLAHRLIEVSKPVAIVDLDEMQGISRRGDRRRFAGLEHH